MLNGVLILVIGLCVGSFINAVAWRWPQNLSINGRSKCTHCGQKIVWYDNIPIFSFIWLAGRCRACRQFIAWRYLAVELVSGAIFLLVYWQALQTMLGPEWLTRNLLFAAILILIFTIDAEWYLILDKITLPAIAVVFVVNYLLGVYWLDMLLGALIGGGFFLAQFLVSRGQWIGDGDIRLGFLMGVMLGYQLVLVALFLAYIVGSLVALVLIASQKKKLSSAVPFGTFLSAATLVALLYGNNILDWYLALFY